MQELLKHDDNKIKKYAKEIKFLQKENLEMKK